MVSALIIITSDEYMFSTLWRETHQCNLFLIIFFLTCQSFSAHNYFGLWLMFSLQCKFPHTLPLALMLVLLTNVQISMQMGFFFYLRGLFFLFHLCYVKQHILFFFISWFAILDSGVYYYYRIIVPHCGYKHSLFSSHSPTPPQHCKDSKRERKERLSTFFITKRKSAHGSTLGQTYKDNESDSVEIPQGHFSI